MAYNNNEKSTSQSIVLKLSYDEVNAFKAALSSRLAKLYDERAKLLAAGKVFDAARVKGLISQFSQMLEDLENGNDIKTDAFISLDEKANSIFKSLITFLSS